MIEGWGISCEIAPVWMSLVFTDDHSTLVQVMAWCCQATSHYLSQCWPRSLLPYGVTRPQWINAKEVWLHKHWNYISFTSSHQNKLHSEYKTIRYIANFMTLKLNMGQGLYQQMVTKAHNLYLLQIRVVCTNIMIQSGHNFAHAMTA